MKRLLFGLALATALSGVSVAAAGRTQSSIILNTPAAYSASTLSWAPRLGESVTFTASYPDSLNRYWLYVNVLCYQGPDHVLVFAVSHKPDSSFLLGGTSSPWLQSGGPATCQADLFYWSNGGKYTVLASTEFEAQ